MVLCHVHVLVEHVKPVGASIVSIVAAETDILSVTINLTVILIGRISFTTTELLMISLRIGIGPVIDITRQRTGGSRSAFVVPEELNKGIKPLKAICDKLVLPHDVSSVQ